MTGRGPRRVSLSLRVPAEHAQAVAKYAGTLTRATRINVTPSAAGAAVLEAGLVALGLIEASERVPVVPTTPKRVPATSKKGPKRTARKP